MTGTLRQPRARRRSTRQPLPAVRTDLAERLRSLQSRLQRNLERADVLVGVIRSVNASLEPEKVAQAIINQASEWMPASGWLLIAVDDGGRIRTLGSQGLSDSLQRSAQAVGEWVMQSAEVFASADLASDSRVIRLDVDPAAAIGLPLECRGHTVGALVAVDRQPSARQPRFAARPLATLLAALEPGALALDNALRIQRAESLSVTDDLTQLYNSRYLSQVLRRETKRAARSKRPLSLLFIDLDGFKAINDTHGHLFGSRALVEAAGVIRASARETDIVARFGGDEFALVLPDTGSEGALYVGGRIRERLAAHRFLEREGFAIGLTASVGVASLPDAATTAEGLLHAADRAMYWVKDRGKNGIRVAAAE